jgi:hypothetical protein
VSTATVEHLVAVAKEWKRLAGADEQHGKGSGDGASELSERTVNPKTQYLDDLVDGYVGWREACALVAEAYRSWRFAAREDQQLAFGDYMAALNGEEEAAVHYQRTVERLAALTAV